MNAATSKLSPDEIARLTDAAFEVIVGHGVTRPSVEVELALWDSLTQAHDRAHRGARWRWLTGGKSPTREEVFAALVGAAFAVAMDSGAEESELLELELDLLFALHVVDVREHARAVLAA